MRSKPYAVTTRAYAVFERTVRPGGGKNSGRIFVPRKLEGKRVVVLVIDSIDD